MTAHYFATKTRKTLIIANGPSIVGGEEIEVSGKTEARKIAAERGAKCWNF